MKQDLSWSLQARAVAKKAEISSGLSEPQEASTGEGELKKEE